MFRSQVFTPYIKEAWHTFHSCAMPLLLAIILVQTNSHSRALATLHLSGTVIEDELMQEVWLSRWQTACNCSLLINTQRLSST